MEISPTIKIPGTRMDAPTGNWLFQFTNVPENSGYTLHAYNSQQTADQNNITVNGLALPPMPAPAPPEPPPPLPPH